MKTKTLKLTAILLITAGIFAACSCIEIEIHDETCPIKEMLVGKWDIVIMYSPHSIFRDTVQTTGHIEYFPDGRMRMFRRTTNEYMYGTFAVEVRKGTPFPWAPNEVIEYWHLHRHLDSWESGFNVVGIFRGKNEKIIFPYEEPSHILLIYKRKQ